MTTGAAPGRRALRSTSRWAASNSTARHFLTAGEALQRAGVYYHFASFLFVHDIPQMKAAHKKQIECRQAALPYLRPPGERVEIPYQGKILAGILRKPAGVERPPVVVMAVGLDSTKEETEAYEAPFLARGIATLVFEGPGQGEAQYDFAIRGDYEVPVAAVLDFVETRRDLDTARIAMWGVSLGGYYAPRAAAFDRRIKACIALGGAVRLGRRLGRPAGPDARGLPRPQPLQDRSGGTQECGNAHARGRRAKNQPVRFSSSTVGSTASSRRKTPSGWRAKSKAR